MSSGSNVDLEGDEFNHDNSGDVAEPGDGPYEDEDQDWEQDEDGDLDFNPFLGEPLSPEDASSSLSSEIECLDLHVFENDENSIESADIQSTNRTDGVEGHAIEDSERGDDEFLMQYSDFPGGMYETAEEQENETSSETDVNDEDGARMLSSAVQDNNPLMDINDEDAISKRTRAHYSLASFTLDELETFLQETDDEDDIQNVDVDEEEEYRKFLASVLLGGDSNSHADQENVIVDDDDEDNDADFEIEIEEALESDLDENIDDKARNHEPEITSRRPETRQTKRQKKSEIERKKLLQQINRPLRPLLPVMPNAPLIRFRASDCLSPSAGDGSINGFTPHQIGQLHNLIYEHVQLLIQVFSICVLDPARQHIASQVQGLLSDVLSKRNQALASRKVAYPASCFSRPFVHPAELPTDSPTQSISESVTPNARMDASSLEQPPLQNISSSETRNKYVISERYGYSYSPTIDGFTWTPFISGPLLSILDVAPLHLVERYMNDVKLAVHDYRRRRLEETGDPCVDREPMFPSPGFPPSASSTAESSIRNSTRTADTLPSSSPIQQPPKKTMAAILIESSMKQPVALVPKVIVKLSERFFQLFNPALFPRKPPAGPVANRVLFTDAEDELLAMGLMEYNTDWKAIQQRFLPCKSKHQIFVRQKNRSSGKAPENPIKAVKRMKGSPLTEDELARIEEGLRIFKLDWMSVWKFMVPHRDPSLLPRQWRTALGIQRSYKIDPEKREKRRLQDLKRRQNRDNLPNGKDLPEGKDDGSEFPGQNGEDPTCNEDETYVHEAFLADWRPGTTSPSRKGTYTREQLSENNTVKELPYGLTNSGHPHASSNLTQAGYPGNILEKRNPSITGSSRPPLYMRPYRARRDYSPKFVKLAPDLPPVNLPPSARIISKSALKNSRCELSISGGGIGTQNGVYKHTTNSNPVPVHKTNAQEHNITPLHPVENSIIRNDTESDLHMHPLLFKAPNEGHLPYYPLKSGICSSSSFSFCTKTQPELSLLHNPHQADATANYNKDNGKSKEDNPSSIGFDFHPLLQIGACSNAHLQENSDTNHREFPFNGSTSATSTKRYNPIDTSSANELDLDIHLSVTSRMENVSGANIANQRNSTRSTVRITKEIAQNNKTSNCGAATPNNNISRCSLDNVGDHSLQEIVMEHEELSDSDEEIDGHVQFECEEMADSEGEEGSDCVQSTHNKETLKNVGEKVSSTVANGDKLSNAEGSSTWLSLNSFVPGPS